jgi:hypothetical protein
MQIYNVLTHPCDRRSGSLNTYKYVFGIKSRKIYIIIKINDYMHMKNVGSARDTPA